MWHLQGISVKKSNEALFSTWILDFKETDHSHYSRLCLKQHGREMISLDVRKPLRYLVYPRALNDSSTNNNSLTPLYPQTSWNLSAHFWKGYEFWSRRKYRWRLIGDRGLNRKRMWSFILAAWHHDCLYGSISCVLKKQNSMSLMSLDGSPVMQVKFQLFCGSTETMWPQYWNYLSTLEGVGHIFPLSMQVFLSGNALNSLRCNFKIQETKS